ncbi:MAG: PilN domain-containing protein [Gammaproteobacteria bacterium]|nr:PilN domain-containing protein [Gammaproteobacteria bacterium]
MKTVIGAMRQYTALWARLHRPAWRLSLLEETPQGDWRLHSLELSWCWHRPWFERRCPAPLQGRDPGAVLNQAGLAAPDYVLPARVITRELAYPFTVARGDLAPLLHVDGSKHTPFRSEDLACAWRVRRRDADVERVEVVVSYIPRAELARLRHALGERQPQRGFVSRLDGSDAQQLLRALFWEWRAHERHVFREAHTEPSARAVLPALARALVLPLAMVLALLPAWALLDWRIEARAAEVQQRLRQIAPRVQGARRRIEDARGLTLRLRQIQRAADAAFIPVGLLPRLAELMPPGAVIESLNYRADTGYVELRGRSPNAAAFLQRLQGSRWGDHWQLVGPVRRLAGGQEYFDFSAALRRSALR